MAFLKIGNEQNAILLIQQTQTDPQKAIAELVENSIDAKARRVTITRTRRDGVLCLIVTDDGEGVRAGSDGAPDMEYVATHICDSLKQKLDPKHREGIQGQFGIGVLGFAAVGQELTLRSKRPGSMTRSIRLHACKSDYELDAPSRQLRTPGTEAEIRGVNREIQNRLTAEKLHRYLSEELRDRIKSSGARIVIDDNVGIKKTLVVTPREYSGIPLISGQKEIATALGPMKLDLYFASPKEGDKALVLIARRGTRLLADLLECDELRHEPWSLGVMEGVIDFPALSPSPATRRGFVPDSAYEELVSQLRASEPGLRMEIEQRRKQQDERLSKEMLEKLQRAFAEAMEELSEDYSWFEKGGSDIRANGRPTLPPGGRPKPVLVSKGPLAEVRLSPKIAVIGPDEARALRAKCFDPKGALILSGVSYSWWTRSTLLSLRPNGQVATIEGCGREGEAFVRVTARLTGEERQAESRIVIAKVRNQF
ncbi:MAG: ATP-binding protein, partial [Thermoanaerobaculia bacterium]